MDAELRPGRTEPLERAGENVDACGIAHRDGVVELSRDAVVFQGLAGVIIKLVAVAAVRGGLADARRKLFFAEQPANFHGGGRIAARREWRNTGSFRPASFRSNCC